MTAAAPSDSGEELPAVMVPSGANAGRSPARVSTVVSGAHAFVGVDHQGLALALGNADRHNLLVKDAGFHGGGGALVGGCGHFVLLGAGQAQHGVPGFGAHPHRVPVERIGEPVVGHRVDGGDVSVGPALAGTRQQVRGLRHGFLAAGDHHIGVAYADQAGRRR